MQKYILLCLLFLFPTVIEQCLSLQQARGNLGLHGVYLKIYLNRNFTWASFIIGLVLGYYGYFYYGLGLFLLLMINYLYCIYTFYGLFL